MTSPRIQYIGIFLFLLITCETSIFAQNSGMIGRMVYSVRDGEATIDKLHTDYRGTIYNVPDVINGSPVTSIGSSAFSGCSQLIQIKLPETLKSIGESAFLGCEKLVSIHLPDPINIIPANCFQRCRVLRNITFPMKLSVIGRRAFAECESLKELKMPDALKAIEYSAFEGCVTLTSITLPNTLKSIEGSVFRHCSSLESIILPDSINDYGTDLFKDCSNLKEVFLPSAVSSIKNGTFWGCTKLESVWIPDTISAIHSYAFYNCASLSDLRIPNSVKSILDNAFKDARFDKIYLPKIFHSPSERQRIGILTSRILDSEILLNFDQQDLVISPALHHAQVGDSFNLSSVPVYDGLDYQWYQNGLPIPFSNSAKLQIESLTFEHSGDFFLEITDGESTIRSSTANLVVHEKASIYGIRTAVQLSLRVIPDRLYRIQRSADLINWKTDGEPVSSELNQLSVFKVADSKQQFFRLVEIVP